MPKLLSILLGLLVLLVCGALAAWFLWHTVKKAEDPGRVAGKWFASFIILAILLAVGASSGLDDMGSAFIVPITAAVFGVILGIIWAPHLGAIIAKPFTTFYDGGEAEIEERPFYSIARAKQKLGRYHEAIAEVRKQLAKFSEDYEGWMLLAEIHGDNLKDNDAAQGFIQEILSHSGHAPRNIAFALGRSADWHLQHKSDRDAARASLQQIIDRYPETEFAHTAAQRIAHLASDRMMADQKERPRLAVPHYDEKLGLMGEVARPPIKIEDPDAVTERLVAHLNDHPLDQEAREELAGLYARHYHRLDLAADQIEQMIAAPGVVQKQIVRWLNMLADFHVLVASDRASAIATLQRIIELYPTTAAAAAAEKRIAYIDIEFRRGKSTHAVHLGAYPQNIGLQGHVPPQNPGAQPPLPSP